MQRTMGDLFPAGGRSVASSAFFACNLSYNGRQSAVGSVACAAWLSDGRAYMRLLIYEICRMTGSVLCWTGILLLLYYVPLALCVIGASLFLMPDTFYLVFRKSNVLTESIRVAAVLFLLLFPVYGWWRSYTGDPLVDTHERAQQDVLDYQHRKAMKRFTDNRDFILKGIRHYMDEGNYRFAYAHADEFVYTGDPELMELREAAKRKLIERGEYKESGNSEPAVQSDTAGAPSDTAAGPSDADVVPSDPAVVSSDPVAAP